jgi:ribosomal-protein-alanine N-acetyltransferase
VTTTPDAPPDAGPSIRPAERADLLDVSRIERRSFDDAWPFGQFEEFLGEPGFLVAVSGGRVVGYVVADTIANRGQPMGHVKDLAVHPAWRGRGVATRLLDRALAVLEVAGARRAKLEVRQTNDDAISLYRRFGFEPHHLISRYYDDGEAAAVFLVDLAERWRPGG